MAMKWKLSSLIVLATCLVTAASVRSQPGGSGLSLIAVPTESEAATLRSRIQSGASFEAIAMTYSTDPTAPRSGYMGTGGRVQAQPRISVRVEGVETRRCQCRDASWRPLRSAEADNGRRRSLEIAARRCCARLAAGPLFGGGVSLSCCSVPGAETRNPGRAARRKFQWPGAGLSISAESRCSRTESASIACDFRRCAWSFAWRTDSQPGPDRRHHGSHRTISGSRTDLPAHPFCSLGSAEAATARIRFWRISRKSSVLISRGTPALKAPWINIGDPSRTRVSTKIST